MRPLAFLDIETTGTDPFVHEPWEIGLVLDVDGRVTGIRSWFVEPENIELASDQALTVGGFWDRAPNWRLEGSPPPSWRPRDMAAERLVKATLGAIPVGCNIGFDVSFLRPFLRRQKALPSWHYSPIDVKSMCYAARPSLIGASTDALIEAFEIDAEGVIKEARRRWPDVSTHSWGPTSRHAALADAMLARALFYRVTGLDHAD